MRFNQTKSLKLIKPKIGPSVATILGNVQLSSRVDREENLPMTSVTNLTISTISKLRLALNNRYFNRLHAMWSLKNTNKHHTASGMVETTSAILGDFKRSLVCETACLLNPKISPNFLSQMCREIEQDFKLEEVSKAKNLCYFERNRPSARKIQSIHAMRIESVIWSEILILVENYHVQNTSEVSVENPDSGRRKRPRLEEKSFSFLDEK